MENLCGNCESCPYQGDIGACMSQVDLDSYVDLCFESLESVESS